ncbi:UNKNOWN [Stylonychia lemnae]|uniref:Transmembrane protein n=1 Tax=Stylonychia lemnae TaxID=5949 RepID=A0A078B8M6_STYLE|nr:UNKNOWN [Stylonychia lemnae]|eukprot:CDW90561.1 UNKNOWN [Stylonychia lemnae]
MSSVRSGQQLENMYLALVDKYGQVVQIDSQKKTQLQGLTDITFDLKIELRECQIGESFTDSGQNVLKKKQSAQEAQKLVLNPIIGERAIPQMYLQSVSGLYHASNIYLFILSRGMIKPQNNPQGAVAKRNIISIYSKILMNHLQLIMLSAQFNFQWPKEVADFYSFASPVSQVSQQIISIDCFVQNQVYDENQKVKFMGFKRVYFIKVALMSSAPIILLIICYAVWYVISLAQRQMALLRTKAISSLVILLFFVHPNIVQQMFDVFNCIDIDGETRLKNDLEIICYQDTHRIWSMMVSLTSIIVWGLGIPIFAMLLLFIERKNLQKLDTKQKYGFLFNGYRKEFYYWEGVIMYRKIALIFIQVFIGSFGLLVQALSVLLFLILGIVINLKLKPLSTVALNNIELISLLASNITIYIGIFYIMNSQIQTNSQTQSKDQLKSLKKAYQRGEIMLNQQILERIKVYLDLNNFKLGIGMKKSEEYSETEKIRLERIEKDQQKQIALGKTKTFVDKIQIQNLKNKEDFLIKNISMDFDPNETNAFTNRNQNSLDSSKRFLLSSTREKKQYNQEDAENFENKDYQTLNSTIERANSSGQEEITLDNGDKIVQLESYRFRTQRKISQISGKRLIEEKLIQSQTKYAQIKRSTKKSKAQLKRDIDKIQVFEKENISKVIQQLQAIQKIQDRDRLHVKRAKKAKVKLSSYIRKKRLLQSLKRSLDEKIMNHQEDLENEQIIENKNELKLRDNNNRVKIMREMSKITNFELDLSLMNQSNDNVDYEDIDRMDSKIFKIRKSSLVKQNTIDNIESFLENKDGSIGNYISKHEEYKTENHQTSCLDQSLIDSSVREQQEMEFITIDNEDSDQLNRIKSLFQKQPTIIKKKYQI